MDSFSNSLDGAIKNISVTAANNASVLAVKNLNALNTSKKKARRRKNKKAGFPPEQFLGNVEYKLQVSCHVEDKPSNSIRDRLERLASQMKWRLREGRGEAIYEIGVSNEGTLVGLPENKLIKSLQNLENMAQKLGATVNLLRKRSLNSINMVAELFVRKVPDDKKNIEVRVAVLGASSSGKSTLLGVVTRGYHDDGAGNARQCMFRHLHEFITGHTSSVSFGMMGYDVKGELMNKNKSITQAYIGANACKLVVLMDLAGHKKYARTMVGGLSGYGPHHAMLVVSLEEGMVRTTYEQLGYIEAFSLPFFLVITKSDSENCICTFEDIREAFIAEGFKRHPFLVENEDDVTIALLNQSSKHLLPTFSVSSVTGDGIPLLSKYLHLLSPTTSVDEEEALKKELCEFQVDETFQVPNVGSVVSGYQMKGVLKNGLEYMMGPLDEGTYKRVTVISVHRNKTPYDEVHACESASLQLSCDVACVRRGMVLISLQRELLAILVFQASVLLLAPSTRMKPGSHVTMHIGHIQQTVNVIESSAFNNSVDTEEKVLMWFQFIHRPEYITVGMRLFFREGDYKGIGKVTQILY